jgi:hypothetical protein
VLADQVEQGKVGQGRAVGVGDGPVEAGHHPAEDRVDQRRTVSLRRDKHDGGTGTEVSRHA